MTPSRFYIQPNEQKDEALIIDRQTFEITSNKMFSVGLLPSNVTSLAIEGIIGIKHLITCSYLLLIMKKEEVGQMENQPIFKMTEWKMIPFAHVEKFQIEISNKQASDWNAIYLEMIESVLATNGFYFSYSYDLTNTLQRRILISRDGSIKHRPNLRYDQKFLWNHHLMRDFDRSGSITDRYRLPIILGYVSISQKTLGLNLNWILISRRSTNRAGTRFNSRGIDQNGDVSNFVETEQILEDFSGSFKSSFVQIRGSIPLLWCQNRNYRWKPEIELDPQVDHDSLMKKHFDDLNHQYGYVSVVNLIDSKGHEAVLAQQFNSRQNSNYIQHYHYFDFHKRRKENPKALDQLLNDLIPEIKQQGFFAISRGEVVSNQNGIVRTNCIDCLDRTNVVQSMVAERSLCMQLEYFGCIQPGTSLSKDSDFMRTFREIWTENANAISVQYAGTPALKTDITRYGKRTPMGPINDGLNSISRYVANNFLDDYRQDAIDLFLGNFEGYPSPLYRPWTVATYTSPTAVSIIVFILVAMYLYLSLWSSIAHPSLN